MVSYLLQDHLDSDSLRHAHGEAAILFFQLPRLKVCLVGCEKR
jgi:hypothetical protein